MSKFTYNQCKVCGGDLIHNQETGKYICKYCGNQYTLNENNVLQQITKQDLDDQRTKIVDDIKVVFNDTLSEQSQKTAIQTEKTVHNVLTDQKRKKKIIWSWILIGMLIATGLSTVTVVYTDWDVMVAGGNASTLLLVSIVALSLSAVFLFIKLLLRKRNKEKIRSVLIVGIATLLLIICPIVTLPTIKTNYIQKNQYYMSTMSEFTVSNKVKAIYSGAFSSCTNLTTITFEKGSQLEYIGEYAFSGCTSLENIIIPSSVITIDYHAFSSCTSLKSVTFEEGSSLQTIGSSAFSGCTSLESITIPNSVTSIGGYTFSSCTSLENIIIPSSVITIDYHAFSSCTSLENIIIPSSVSSIGEDAFYDCTSLETVFYEGTANEWGFISIGNYNSQLTSATRYYYSETEPSAEGNFWRYVDGVPTIW